MIFYAYWMLYMEAILANHKLDTTKRPLYATDKWKGPEKFNWWGDK